MRRIRNWYKENKTNKKCITCPEKDMKCLDYHHLEKSRKKMSISRMVSIGCGKKSIKKEIDKCILICSNCHRIIHQKSSTKSKLGKILELIKSELKCVKCAENRSACLDFHHINPNSKMFNIGDCIKMKIEVKELLREINKCIVLCSNCHRKIASH